MGAGGPGEPPAFRPHTRAQPQRAVESLPRGAPRLTMAPVSARREGRGATVLRDTFPPGLAVGGARPGTLGARLFWAPEGGVCPHLCVCVCCWRVSVCTEGHVRLSVHMHALHAGALCLSRLVAPCVYQRASWVYLPRGVYLPPDVSLAPCTWCVLQGVGRGCPSLPVSLSPSGPTGQQSSGFRVRPGSRLLPTCAERGSRQRGCR